MIHIAVAIIVLFLHLMYINTDSELSKKRYWIIACCVVLIVVGFRSYRTGSDTIGYVNRFLNLRTVSFTSIGAIDYRDIGFFYLVKTIGIFTSSPSTFLLITAFLSFIGVFVIAYRYSNNPILVLFFHITLGNYLFLLTGIRQAISMSICLLSLSFVEKRKVIPFVLSVLLASTIHHSAYIFLPTYFLAWRKINLTSIVNTVIVTIVAYVFYDRLLQFANDIIGYNYEIEELDNGLVFYFILLVIVAFGYLRRDFWIIDERQNIAMNLAITCTVIWTFRLIGRTAERPSMYWLNLVPIVLTNTLYAEQAESKLKSDQLIKFLAIILSLLLFFKRAAGVSYSFSI